MTFPGNLYGVVLNDKDELAKLSAEFDSPPYGKSPVAPVVYIKPRPAISRGPIQLGPAETVIASSTLALLFARDAVRCSSGEAMSCVGAMALALDISLPQANYYRPAAGQAIRDGFIALGDWMAVSSVAEIQSRIDAEPGHSWSLDRLLRNPGQLIAELSAFMTLRAGDVLLIGLPGDAPVVRARQSVMVTSQGFPQLCASFVEIAS